jgi:hypothetical protein
LPCCRVPYNCLRTHIQPRSHHSAVICRSGIIRPCSFRFLEAQANGGPPAGLRCFSCGHDFIVSVGFHMFVSQDGVSVWMDRWMTDAWLVSSKANLFFLVGSVLNMGAIAIVILLFASGMRNLTSSKILEISLGCLGATAAISAIALMHGMRSFLRRIDNSSRASKVMWLWILVVGLNVGASIYYFSVYRRQVNRPNGQTQ